MTQVRRRGASPSLPSSTLSGSTQALRGWEGGVGEGQLLPLSLVLGYKAVKKGVYPFNKGPTPGQAKRELSHYLPTEPAQPGRPRGSGTESGSVAQQGGVLAGLSWGAAWQCQSLDPRALLDRRWTKEAGENPRTSLGGAGLTEGPCRLGRPGEGVLRGPGQKGPG